MFIILGTLLLLQVLSASSEACPKKLGCLHTRLFLCCYYTHLNDLPYSQENTTTHLSVEGDNIVSLNAEMFRKKNLLGLESLSLVKTGIRSLEERTFEGLVDLRKIIITRNNIEAIVPYTFKGIPFLSHLDLSNNNISRLHSRAFFGLRMLRLLDLTWNSIFELSGEMFEGMKPENLTAAQKKAANVRTKRQLVVNFGFVNTIKPNTFRDVTFTSFALEEYTTAISVLEENVLVGMKDLRNLELHGISAIEIGAFSGLNSLKKLVMSTVRLKTINSKTFEDLINLKVL